MVKRASIKKIRAASFPRDTLVQAEKVRLGWNEVGKRLVVPNLTLAKFLSKLAETKESIDKAERLKLERAKAIEDRNVYLSELWDLTKRIRNAAKATFGDFSPELQLLLNPTNGFEPNEVIVDDSEK